MKINNCSYYPKQFFSFLEEKVTTGISCCWQFLKKYIFTPLRGCCLLGRVHTPINTPLTQRSRNAGRRQIVDCPKLRAVCAKLKIDIRHQRKAMFEFLTGQRNVWDKKRDYDFGIEDEFGVLWLDPQRDHKLLTQLEQEHGPALNKIRRQPHLQHIFMPNQTTRLANSDIASILDSAQGDPAVYTALRTAVVHGILAKHS